jgi:hypothetical protein
MVSRKHQKSQFVASALREPTPLEKVSVQRVTLVLTGGSESEIISTIPGFASFDGEPRSLVFSRVIAEKIERDHGKILPENLAINANGWDFVLRNVGNNPDKINLIKLLQDGKNFLVLGANRDNGFYMVTHYEHHSKSDNELKNLLRKGDALDRSGRTPSA